MVSALDRAKRALVVVVVLRSLASAYRCSVNARLRGMWRTARARERENAPASGPQHRSKSLCHLWTFPKTGFQFPLNLLVGVPLAPLRILAWT